RLRSGRQHNRAQAHWRSSPWSPQMNTSRDIVRRQRTSRDREMQPSPGASDSGAAVSSSGRAEFYPMFVAPLRCVASIVAMSAFHSTERRKRPRGDGSNPAEHPKQFFENQRRFGSTQAEQERGQGPVVSSGS